MFFSNRQGKSVAISRFFLRGLKTLRPFIQFGCFAGAFYIALSRISDYRHHPTDVIAGKNKSIIGLVLTIKITALLYWKLFSPSEKGEKLFQQILLHFPFVLLTMQKIKNLKKNEFF